MNLWYKQSNPDISQNNYAAFKAITWHTKEYLPRDSFYINLEKCKLIYSYRKWISGYGRGILDEKNDERWEGGIMKGPEETFGSDGMMSMFISLTVIIAYRRIHMSKIIK